MFTVEALNKGVAELNPIFTEFGIFGLIVAKIISYMFVLVTFTWGFQKETSIFTGVLLTILTWSIYYPLTAYHYTYIG